jgi:hypothetical protein
MENKLINFVWIFIGTDNDPYIGELKKYCLIEYSINESNDFSLNLSSFSTKSFPWKPIDELNYADTKTINKMINDGRKFLFIVDKEKYGYISNILNGRYVFNDEENIIIKNKLQEFCNKINII